jgi:NADH:ubiquinone oxidoreductase subunit 3 (subunit A)
VRARSAVLLAGGVGYSLVAASTTPFTLPADVLTGLAIVAMAVLVGVRWPLRPRRARPISASSSSSSSSSSFSSTTGHPYLLWVLLLVIFVAWELFNYLVHGTRANHPTFSSITDAIDRFYLLKALLFLGWLAAALVIVRRGSRSGLRSRSRPG